MENLWTRFDTIAKPEEVNEAKSQFTPIEAGKYRVILEELVTGENKTGLPMLKGKFRIIENNRIIFYNQMLQNLNYPDLTTKNIAEVVTLINGLLGEEIPFTGLGALAELISTIPIGEEYTVEVFYTDKERKFTKLRVIDDSEVPEVEGFHPTDNDDIPF